MDDNQLNSVMKKARTIFRLLSLYHRYRIEGLEHIPVRGPFILAVNHSLATYDGFILGMTVYEQTGRLIKGLGDDLLFRLPFIKEWVGDLGIAPASRENALELLRQGEGLGVAPGGMRESLRPINQRFKVLWQKRKGFVRLAMEAQVPIILAACPKADLIYDVYPNNLTKFLYKNFRVPLPIATGLGPTLLPRPIQLTHYISEPLVPPVYTGESSQVDVFHSQILNRMKELMMLGKNETDS